MSRTLELPGVGHIADAVPDVASEILEEEVMHLHSAIGEPMREDISAYVGVGGLPLTSLIENQASDREEQVRKARFAKYSRAIRKRLARQDQAKTSKEESWMRKLAFQIPFVEGVTTLAASSHAEKNMNVTYTHTQLKDAGVKAAGEASGIVGTVIALNTSIVTTIMLSAGARYPELADLAITLADLMHTVSEPESFPRVAAVVAGAYVGGKIARAIYRPLFRAVPTTDSRLEGFRASYDAARGAIATAYTQFLQGQLDEWDEEHRVIAAAYENSDDTLEGEFLKLEAGSGDEQ